MSTITLAGVSLTAQRFVIKKEAKLPILDAVYRIGSPVVLMGAHNTEYQIEAIVQGQSNMEYLIAQLNSNKPLSLTGLENINDTVAVKEWSAEMEAGKTDIYTVSISLVSFSN